MKQKVKNKEKLLQMIVTIIIIVFVLWFIVINPIVKFKKMEKTVLDASKRYFEINTIKLPTNNKIRSISLQTLYDQDFIKEDLKAPYTNKVCNAETSWSKVTKENEKYKYIVYLECGLFKSKVDHKGPTIKLKGKDEIIINKGTKYKEQGVESVIDNSDGKMSVEKVTIDSSKVDTSKVGTYEVSYTATDSYENKTVKIRTVKVIETLNYVVKTNTDNSNIYKGNVDNNYLQLDGILFKIVGLNSDGTVKVVSTESLASIDYDGITSWLNDYFYEMFSDSAKQYIVKKSKWCTDTMSNIDNYKKCTNYTKKQAIGLLSVLDYNNAISENGNNNLTSDMSTWTYTKKTEKESWINSYYTVSGGLEDFKNVSNNEIYGIRPALNITENASIISGNGTSTNPYILKGNQNKTKKGNKISSVFTGSYISYSGYIWRVIEKQDDGTTKVIMVDSINTPDAPYYTIYANSSSYYNPESKNNIAYKISNDISKYIKTGYFVNKEITINHYDKEIKYENPSSTKKYSLKFIEVSLFDLFSATKSNNSSFWYQESSKNNNQLYINSMSTGTTKIAFDSTEEKGIKLIGYLNKDVVIKDGNGSLVNPYTLTK